jgi:hypothetical protein
MKIPRIFFPLAISLALAIGILACGDDDGGQTAYYSVGGIVNGLSGSMVLQCNGTNDLTVTSDGAFTFNTPLADGAGYAVTVAIQPSGQTCTVNNGTGTLSGTNVTGVQVDCVTADVITRVSVASDGTEENNWSWFPSISGDGRYVAFHSGATNLVPGDSNVRSDVFVHDRLTGETTRVSVASDGTEGNDFSLFSSISGDGRYVAFQSLASNLVPGDANGWWDVFVHDRVTGETTRVSVASDGAEGNDRGRQRCG